MLIRYHYRLTVQLVLQLPDHVCRDTWIWPKNEVIYQHVYFSPNLILLFHRIR